MTNKEFYNKLISLESLESELKDKALELLQKEESKNALKKAKENEKRQVEYLPIEESILKVCESEKALLTSQIAEAIGLTTSKTSPRCKALVEKGKLVEEDVKVVGVGTRKGYKLA